MTGIETSPKVSDREAMARTTGTLRGSCGVRCRTQRAAHVGANDAGYTAPMALPAPHPLPPRFDDVEHLEDVMSTPSAALVDALRAVPGDIVVLGVGGKMGPTLARMARRAAPSKRIVGVARFTEPGLRGRLESTGHRLRIAADLLSREQIAARSCSDAANVVFMAGRKFGSAGSEWLTWAMNAHVPALVAERFTPEARIVAFSTACVYPFVDVDGPGADERTPPTPPPGEYANSCVARERMFEHFSHARGTAGRLIRLSYAIDMRYGVLHDVARKIVEPRDDRPGDGPRQHHLAGRRQPVGAARAGALHRADHAAQRQRTGGEHPRHRARRSGSGLGNTRRASSAARRAPRGSIDTARPLNGCSGRRRCRSRPCSTGPPTGPGAAWPAWASRRTTKPATEIH